MGLKSGMGLGRRSGWRLFIVRPVSESCYHGALRITEETCHLPNVDERLERTTPRRRLTLAVANQSGPSAAPITALIRRLRLSKGVSRRREDLL